MKKAFIFLLSLVMVIALVACGDTSSSSSEAEQLSKITITTPPAATVYESGSSFDPTGMVVSAIYNTGRSETIQDYTVVDGDNLEYGVKEVTISYADKTVVQPIEVKPAKLQVTISVKRTGNILTGIGQMAVLIDDEEVFDVRIDTTETVEITMTEGVHTIQTTGQGDKSKKVEFEVVKGETNEFFFISEISNWYGIELEERQYIPEG